MAGGFMSGLGRSFSRQFDTQVKLGHERKQDAFRVAYDNWTRKRNEYEEDEKSWTKNLEAGNLIAERYGAPKEAGLKAAEWLAAGYSVDDVDEMMRTTKFVVAPEVESPELVQEPDMQMQESGLQQPQQGLQETDPVNKPKEQEGFLGGIFANAGKSDAEKAAGRLQDELGISPEEFDRVNSGFKRPESPNIQMTLAEANFSPLEEFGLADGITDAKLKAAMVEAAQYEKSGDPVLEAKAARFNAILPDIQAANLSTSDPETAAKLVDVLKGTQTIRLELSQEKVAAATMADQGKELVDMVTDSQGRVLTLASRGLSVFEQVRTETNAVLDLVSGIIEQSGGDPTENTMLAGLDNFINGQVEAGSYTAEEARQVREFHASAIRYAYAVGKALGQQGNGFSNRDFENIYNSVVAVSNDPIAFENNLKRFIQGQVSQINSQNNELRNLADIAFVMTSFPSIAPFLEKGFSDVETLMNDSTVDWLGQDFKTSEARADLGQEEEQPDLKGERRRDKAGNIWVYTGRGPFNDPSSWEQYNPTGR